MRELSLSRRDVSKTIQNVFKRRAPAQRDKGDACSLLDFRFNIFSIQIPHRYGCTKKCNLRAVNKVMHFKLYSPVYSRSHRHIFNRYCNDKRIWYVVSDPCCVSCLPPGKYPADLQDPNLNRMPPGLSLALPCPSPTPWKAVPHLFGAWC